MKAGIAVSLRSRGLQAPHAASKYSPAKVQTKLCRKPTSIPDKRQREMSCEDTEPKMKLKPIRSNLSTEQALAKAEGELMNMRELVGTLTKNLQVCRESLRQLDTRQPLKNPKARNRNRRLEKIRSTNIQRLEIKRDTQKPRQLIELVGGKKILAGIERKELKTKPLGTLLSCKKLSDYFPQLVCSAALIEKASKPAAYVPVKVDNCSQGNWRQLWRILHYKPSCQMKTFIFIHNSKLKPYFIGPCKGTFIRNSLKPLDFVDYDQDSSDELEEMNAEELGEEEAYSDEEDDDLNDTLESFVVPDNYLSDDEGESESERVQMKLVRNEVKDRVNLDTIQLHALAMVSISNLQFPHRIQPPRSRPHVQAWVPDLLELLEGKVTKSEVLAALREM